MADPLLVDRDGAVVTLTLNRPDALNALDVPLKLALRDAVEEIRTDHGVRAVVLAGAGRAFCVGQDLREHVESLGGPQPLSTVAEHYNPLVLAIARLDRPVVAAVRGMAAGAGASLAFLADLRVGGPKTAFLMAFANVGLAADTGASWTLPRLVGHGRALAMLMLAEPVTAAQALEMGLVNAVVPAADVAAAAAELAGRLAAGPTLAYAAIKQALARGATSDLATALETEAGLQARLGGTDDHKQAVEAFLAKQAPSFRGH